MNDEQDNDEVLRAAYERWQASRVPNDREPSLDELAALAAGEGDSEGRIAALDAALGSPGGARDLTFVLAAQAAARAAAKDDADASPEHLKDARPTTMTNRTSSTRPAPAWRRLLPLAAALTLTLSGGALWLQGRTSETTRSGGTLPPVSLIGERVGVLLWHAVADATSYRIEVLDPAGTLLFTATEPDTVAALPPGFEAPKYSSWWVRAYAGRREIAASPMTAFY